MCQGQCAAPINTQHCAAIAIGISDMTLEVETPYEICSTALNVSRNVDVLHHCGCLLHMKPCCLLFQL